MTAATSVVIMLAFAPGRAFHAFAGVEPYPPIGGHEPSPTRVGMGLERRRAGTSGATPS